MIFVIYQNFGVPVNMEDEDQVIIYLRKAQRGMKDFTWETVEGS